MVLRVAAEADTAVVEDGSIAATGDLFEGTQDAPGLFKGLETATPVDEAPAAVQATRAIAKARSTALAKPNAPKFFPAFSTREDVIGVESIAALGVGAFSRITVDVGGFTLNHEDGKRELGKEVKVRLISWNHRYMVSAGANTEEAKKELKISYDNETIYDTGETIKEVIEGMRQKGYTQAASKHYIDLWVNLLTANGREFPEGATQIYQVQLSPESVKRFSAFQVATGFMLAGAVEPTDVLVLSGHRGTYAGHDYGFLSVALDTPA
jgi:hypothetical protein